jgi:predicted Zn-ribbon and HTH transcriptional regulator
MTTIRRAIILKLASAAYEMDLDVMSGELKRDEDGHWRIGQYDLIQWLADHEGEELVLVLGSLADERPVEPRTCRTCGRDYTDLECPYCRANRIRLRGHA